MLAKRSVGGVLCQLQHSRVLYPDKADSMKTRSSIACGNFVQKSFLLFSFLSFLAIPALAAVTINSPSNNSEVGSPFTLSASSATCSSQNVSTMGYSFDSSADTTVINGGTIQASVGSASGAHTLHVKAWGDQGASCVADVTINVTAGSSTGSGDPLIPSNAVTVSSIQAMSNWAAEHDTGGSGSSSGSTTVVSSPSLNGSTRKFVTRFSNSGDERYSISFADDVDSENLFYDAWIYLTSSAGNIANIEMDVNQTMANGQTVLGCSAMAIQAHGITPSTREAPVTQSPIGTIRAEPTAIHETGQGINGIMFKPAFPGMIPGRSLTIRSGSTERRSA